MSARGVTTLVGVVAVVVSGGIAVALADDERAVGSNRAPIRAGAVDLCRGGASATASYDLDIAAVDRKTAPRSPEAAIARARPHLDGLRDRSDVTFAAAGPAAGNVRWGGRPQVMYLGRDPDGRHRAQFDLVRGRRGAWAIRFTHVCTSPRRD